MFRILSITAFLLGLILFGGLLTSSPAIAVAMDASSIESMDCEDCSSSNNPQSMCVSVCAVSSFFNDIENSNDTPQLSTGERFAPVTYALLSRAEFPEPHPPK